MPAEVLKLTQEFQKVKGTLGSQQVTGKLLGDQLTLTAGGKTIYTGRVNGKTIEGTMKAGGKTTEWKASKAG